MATKVEIATTSFTGAGTEESAISVEEKRNRRYSLTCSDHNDNEDYYPPTKTFEVERLSKLTIGDCPRIC